MIKSFFNKKTVVKRMSNSGHVRRFTATATIDGSIQQDGRATELLQADFGERYIGFFETSFNIVEGDKLIEDTTGVEYIADTVTTIEHSITGTSYLEVLMYKDKSRQNDNTNL